jgi:F-type H+-transporting ATPase subunit delta
VAGPVDVVAQRGEELFGTGRAALPRLAEELPAFARLLRAEPRLRAALTDIAVGTEAKKALLADVFEGRVDPGTLDAIGLLVEETLSPEELERAAAQLAVRSVLAAAEVDGSLENVEDELFRFARIIEANRELRSALTDPVLPAEAKLGLVRDLLEGRAEGHTVALARFVLESRGERDPAHALTELAELAASRRGRVVVEARTAIPIDVQRRVRLADALSRSIGRQVDLEIVIDPDVVGGVTARVGDELIDGSVKRKLELALEELTT